MATDTSQELGNKVIYEVDVRNHSAEGNFKGLQRDLARIKNLGVDIIWLMPIYPIGRKNRKGSLGSPYSIANHRQINPEFGVLADFQQLVTAIHDNGMQIMLDIVFNHTSPDSLIFQEHPDWFYKNENGLVSRKVADWADIIDFDYSRPELWVYQIDTLKYWVNLGVDGFRCDVAPVVLLEFWLKARSEIQKIKKDFIWLAESAEPDFILQMRRQGFNIHSDGEMYQAFDITYDYDVFDTFKAYLTGRIDLENYLQLICHQETIYPVNFIKLRFLENHDQPRIASFIHSQAQLRQWTAFNYFNKGTTLLLAGQEAQTAKQSSLFDRDPVDWSGLTPDFTAFLQTMVAIKKDPLRVKGYYQIHHLSQPGVIMASYKYERQTLLGIFNVEDQDGLLAVDFPDGKYTNLVDLQEVIIEDERIKLQSKPVIIKIEA
jgi:glycosidase